MSALGATATQTVALGLQLFLLLALFMPLLLLLSRVVIFSTTKNVVFPREESSCVRVRGRRPIAGCVLRVVWDPCYILRRDQSAVTLLLVLFCHSIFTCCHTLNATKRVCQYSRPTVGRAPREYLLDPRTHVSFIDRAVGFGGEGFDEDEEVTTAS